MSLLTLKRRVQKLESIRAQKSQHMVVVFNGTPEADANADRRIEEGRAEAERLGKELRVIRIRWQDATPSKNIAYLRTRPYE
jgi:hypothetical protein